jgi:hypothetical protein
VLSFTIDGHVQVTCVRPVVNSRFMHSTTRTWVTQRHEALQGGSWFIYACFDATEWLFGCLGEKQGVFV